MADRNPNLDDLDAELAGIEFVDNFEDTTDFEESLPEGFNFDDGGDENGGDNGDGDGVDTGDDLFGELEDDAFTDDDDTNATQSAVLTVLKTQLEEQAKAQFESDKANKTAQLQTIASNLDSFAEQIARLQQAQDLATKSKDISAALSYERAIRETTERRNSLWNQGQVLVKELNELKPREITIPETQKTGGVNELAKTFAKKNKIDFRSDNPVAKFVREQSQRLQKDGYDIAGQAHYRVLQRRLAAKFPKQFGESGSQQQQRGQSRSPVVGASTGGNGGGGKATGKTQIPKRLIQAARIAGIDTSDKKALAKLINEYKSTAKEMGNRK